jgi:hypothetical protein
MMEVSFNSFSSVGPELFRERRAVDTCVCFILEITEIRG